MSLPINVVNLLSGQTVEWERIEFKTGWNPEAIIHTISAFANDINNWGGGYIVIGVSEKDGRPVLPPVGIDVKEIDSIQKKLLSLCNRIKPSYFPIVEPVFYKKKHILVVWAPGGQNRPYKAPVCVGKDSTSAYYIRRFSNTVKAKPEDEKELISLTGNIPFDDRIHHDAELADLKLPLIQSFLHEIKSDLYQESSKMDFLQLCRQMMIVEGSDEYIKPKNIGLLLFNDKPQKFIPLSQIEIVQFATDAGGDLLDEKIFQGPIQQQINDVLRYLKNVIIKEQIIKHADRAQAERFFNYSYVALEESIVNAMYHRDYEIREPVEIRVNSDSIQILSFSGLDRSIKKKDFENKRFVSRRYRNRRIGEFFKELKLTEGRCTGIPKIRSAMKKNGSPEPIFETDEERIYFLVTLPIHQFFIPIQKNQGEVEGEVEGEVKNKIKSKAKDEENISLNNVEKTILKASKSEFEPRSEIITRAGYKKNAGFLYRAFTNLLEYGLIDYSIPDKPKSSKQRYMISEEGQKYLTGKKGK